MDPRIDILRENPDNTFADRLAAERAASRDLVLRGEFERYSDTNSRIQAANNMLADLSVSSVVIDTEKIQIHQTNEYPASVLVSFYTAPLDIVQAALQGWELPFELFPHGINHMAIRIEVQDRPFPEIRAEVQRRKDQMTTLRQSIEQTISEHRAALNASGPKHWMEERSRNLQTSREIANQLQAAFPHS